MNRNFNPKVSLFMLMFLFFSSVFFSVYGDDYKGKPKYKSPGKEILPDSKIYNPDQKLDESIENVVKERIETLAKQHNVAGITLSVIVPGKGVGHFETGFASLPDKRPVDQSTVFYWASVAKMITATTILMLVQEDKIQLDDKLSKWFPEFQEAQKITVKHLLNHTNGLYSFNYDSTFHNSDRYYSPNELLVIARSQKNYFPPGQHWAYTNTGYLLLALIAEKIEQKTFHQIVQQKIAEPQKLKSLRILAPQESPENLALAHQNGKVIVKDHSVPLGAGNLVSNSADMALFFHALLTGKVLPVATVAGMYKELFPMFDDPTMYYGQGIMLYDLKKMEQANNVWLGHSGGTENYKAIVAYDVDSKIILAASINQNKPVEALALDIIKLISQHSQ